MISSPSRILPGAMLLTAVLVVLWAGTAIPVLAQVQIEQVQSAPDEVDGPSPTAATGGNSAAVRQEGNRNHVAIRQAGTGNRAVAKQIGTDNEIAIAQDGGTRLRPNLAVAVHEGSSNRTDIVQRGSDNVADIRLDGKNNVMNLVQDGNKNQFLLDTTIDGMEKTVVQNGNGNTMNTTVPVNAKMNGNGMKLVIRRDALGPLSPTL